MKHLNRSPRIFVSAFAFVATALTVHADDGIPEVTSFEPTQLERKIFDGPGVTVTRGEDIYSTLCAGCPHRQLACSPSRRLPFVA